MDKEKQEEFQTLFLKCYNQDVSSNVSTKSIGYKNFDYLNWAVAWREFVTVFPDATYETVYFDGKPYYIDDFGAIVKTRITACGKTLEQQLAVLDGANQPMKAQAYEYAVKTKNPNQPVVKKVNPITMADIENTKQRCLVKNIAMFSGIGLKIYAGDNYDSTLDDKDKELLIAKDDLKVNQKMREVKAQRLELLPSSIIEAKEELEKVFFGGQKIEDLPSAKFQALLDRPEMALKKLEDLKQNK